MKPTPDSTITPRDGNLRMENVLCLFALISPHSFSRRKVEWDRG